MRTDARTGHGERAIDDDRPRPAASWHIPGSPTSRAQAADGRGHAHRRLRRARRERAARRADAAQQLGRVRRDLRPLDRVGYLARSVEGFFLNGGSAATWCASRTARRATASAPGPEHAACAERVVERRLGQADAAGARAQRGALGQQHLGALRRNDGGAQTLLTLDLDIGSGEARVNIDARLRARRAGAHLRPRELRLRRDHRGRGQLVKWATATPIMRRYRAAGPTYLEVLEFEMHVVAARIAARCSSGLQMLAAVAPLRAAHHQRASRSSSRLEDLQLEVAAAAQPAGAERGGEADRRPRRHRRR